MQFVDCGLPPLPPWSGLSRRIASSMPSSEEALVTARRDDANRRPPRRNQAPRPPSAAAALRMMLRSAFGFAIPLPGSVPDGTGRSAAATTWGRGGRGGRLVGGKASEGFGGIFGFGFFILGMSRAALL